MHLNSTPLKSIDIYIISFLQRTSPQDVKLALVFFLLAFFHYIPLVKLKITYFLSLYVYSYFSNVSMELTMLSHRLDFKQVCHYSPPLYGGLMGLVVYKIVVAFYNFLAYRK